METIYQHLFLDNQDIVWAVDRQAAAKTMVWIKRSPDTFGQDLTGMATYFPHWILVGAAKEKPITCQRCGTFYVPTHDALRCLKCHRIKKASNLMWLGQLPIPARPEPAFQDKQQALQKQGFPEIEAGGTPYLLIPLTFCYPKEWPNVEPTVRYAKRWLTALKLPASNANYHLIQNGRACIFGWGQWYSMPVHAVLQQRMVNHALSLFKIVAGQRPEEAFIGRVHSQPWQPEPADG